ncbi:hypothetical protein K435DRAFT_851073 [Dendrothele bispora CBS 962.96]|uniref:Uncharacterized protein n=1 Tax=Dendrothele bispora (strain CBS 962.96) TaxID=1314807 RepID=A0A4S8MMW6_DENBC|nr:hypothetical protein K435DRAFT_851073 [Dendrothele bispora CBS 962.96]
MSTPVPPSGTVEQPPSNSFSAQIHDNTSSCTPQSGEIVHLSESSAVLDLIGRPSRACGGLVGNGALNV